MKYKVELSYVCHQATQPWWSKIEIKGSETRITKKEEDRNGCDTKGKKNKLITIKIHREKKRLN